MSSPNPLIFCPFSPWYSLPPSTPTKQVVFLYPTNSTFYSHETETGDLFLPDRVDVRLWYPLFIKKILTCSCHLKVIIFTHSTIYRFSLLRHMNDVIHFFISYHDNLVVSQQLAYKGDVRYCVQRNATCYSSLGGIKLQLVFRSMW